MERKAETGCSCLTWTTEGGVPLWGRNFDLNLLPPDTQVTFLPPGTAYAPLRSRDGSHEGALGCGRGRDPGGTQ